MSLHVTVAATPPRRTIPAHDLGDKPMLWAWLRFGRATVEAKVDDLDDDAARRRLVPSATTLAGVLTHLTTVEQHWFGTVLGGGNPPMPFDTTRPDGDWDTAGVPLALILDGYRRACADSDEVIGRLAMDSIGAQTDGDYTLRWAMIHVFGDTVRHAGQADIIRANSPTAGEAGDPRGSLPSASTPRERTVTSRSGIVTGSVSRWSFVQRNVARFGTTSSSGCGPGVSPGLSVGD